MSFWEANCAILKKRYPLLYEELCREADLAPEDIQTDIAASGCHTLKIKGNYIHSPRDPQREGRRLADNALHQPSGPSPAGTQNSPVIILGFGLGYAAQAAAELWPTKPIIVVEKYRSLIRMAMECLDFKTLLARDNTAFIIGGTGEGLSGALSLFEESLGEILSPIVLKNTALTSLDKEWYGMAEERIRSYSMREDANAATLKRFGKRWVRNLSRNISFIRDLPGISGLTGIAKDIPVFLAAAGPGLDQCASLLGEIEKRCIIVAVDTSLRFLLKHGIYPDFVLVVDPQFWNSRHLDRCSLSNTKLIAESAVYPDVLRLPFKGKYLCSSLFPLGSFLEKRTDPKGSLGAGGSVATTAWDFARLLGTEEIWIAGLDLAFPENKTHFRGAIFEERSHAESCRLRPAETWQANALRSGQPLKAPSSVGSKVLTDRRLSLYAAWFESRFSQFPVIRNYSLSLGGLAIKGLENTQADKLLAKPEKRNEINQILKTSLSRIDKNFFDPEEIKNRETCYTQALAALLSGLKSIKTEAQKGANITEKALKYLPKPEEQAKTLKELDKVNKNIAESEVKEVAGFLFPPFESAHDKNSTGDPWRIFLETSKKFYNSIAEIAHYNIGELEKFN